MSVSDISLFEIIYDITDPYLNPKRFPTLFSLLSVMYQSTQSFINHTVKTNHMKYLHESLR